MCGFAGLIGARKLKSSGLIVKMSGALSHRGPDDEGYIGIDIEKKALCRFYGAGSRLREGTDITAPHNPVNGYFAHRRLSIIDLSAAGSQPMSYNNENLWLVFNGEIYNCKELKDVLRRDGFEFKTNTDSEVILAAYQKWDTECTKYFNGDWAFALYDRGRNSAFFSRDRYGIKPLYFFHDAQSGIFSFASEIKALLHIPRPDPDIDKDRCLEFLVFSLSNHSGRTLFNNILQIEPGHNLVLDLNSFQFEKKRYYDVQYNLSPGDYDHKKALAYADDIRDLLIDAVRLRLQADVPLGTCLSGGMDSASIVVIINKILKEGGTPLEQIGEKQKTFTASFPGENIDEAGFAEIVNSRMNAEAHMVFPTLEGIRDEIKRIVWHQDEPFGSASIYAQWKVMEEASKHVKVVLDGQGGDEIFGGYPNHRTAYLVQLLKSGRIAIFLTEMMKTMGMYKSPHHFINDMKLLPLFLIPGTRQIILYLLLKKRHLDRALSKLDVDSFNVPCKSISSFVPDLNRNLFLSLTRHSLPALLRYEDRNSMAFSIESRTPFTDYRLVDYLFAIPACYKFRNGWSKWLLRLAMKDLLPEEIRWRKDKVGFAVSGQMREYDRDRLFEIWSDVFFPGRV